MRLQFTLLIFSLIRLITEILLTQHCSVVYEELIGTNLFLIRQDLEKMETETERNGKTKNEAVRPKKWILEALTSLALKNGFADKYSYMKKFFLTLKRIYQPQ